MRVRDQALFGVQALACVSRRSLKAELRTDANHAQPFERRSDVGEGRAAKR
jgi:hypothetical protein